MTRRLVITGPESTGKTTLAAALGSRLGSPWIGEASRAYAEGRAREGRALTVADVEPIASMSIAGENEALARAPELLVLDTDLLSTVVYSRHHYASCPAWIEAEARARRAELYLLLEVDLPWIADGVRDRPDNRELMFGLFRDTLAEFGCLVERVGGRNASRLRAALDAIEARGWLVPHTARV